MDYPLPEEKIKVPRFEEAGGFYTTPERSRLMAKIRAANTKPEIALRKVLWGFGLRYRVHLKNLPGKPDLAFPRWRVAVFVDGDFWHGHDWAEKQHKIKQNKAFWRAKIERNMQRDREVNARLEQMGWHVLRLWEHEIERDFGASVFRVLRFVQEKAGAKLGDLLFDAST
ncbi:MAG: very short patch repair endonuclease [Saprospiraceae bacterium]